MTMKARGSITVFSALTFMLVASFLFALLEASRIQMLATYTDMTSELAIESVLAEYQPRLWEEYRVLCLDGAYGGEAFSEDYLISVFGERVCQNLNIEGDGKGIMELKLQSVRPVEYQILTDAGGQVFLHYISEYMKRSLPQDLARNLYESCVSGQEIADEDLVGNRVEEAKTTVDNVRLQQALETRAIEETNGEQQRLDVQQQEYAEPQMELKENPLDVVMQWKQRGILGMLVEDSQNISTLEIVDTEKIEARVLCQGKSCVLPERDWYGQILTAEYANQYLSNYLTPKEERALAYEAEYIICGENSDRANLEGVAQKLLLTREAANIVHIMMDAQKRMQAAEIATVLVGATVNPVIIKVVEMGVIGAWAYAESVLDVRAILQGNTVALIKTKEEWCSNLQSLSEILAGGVRATECENGWEYKDYVRTFIIAMDSKNVAYRMMNVMEQTIRRFPLYRNFRMDHMLVAVGYEVTYETSPLFWDLSILEQPWLEKVQYRNTKYLSYY